MADCPPPLKYATVLRDMLYDRLELIEYRAKYYLPHVVVGIVCVRVFASSTTQLILHAAVNKKILRVS